MKLKYPPVVIIWDDAESDAAWTEEPAHPLKPTLALTMGFLIVDQTDYVLIADSYFLEGKTISNTTKIPRGMIKEFHYITIHTKREKKNVQAEVPQT